MATLIANGKTYTSAQILVGKTTWNFLKVENADGSLNYINVAKCVSRFPTPGKNFKNYEEAAAYYKSPAIKTALLYSELNLTQAQ